MAVSAPKVTIDISKKVFNANFFPHLNCDKRYLVFYGGAGSGKSFFVAQRYIYRLLTEKRRNLLVIRAIGNTNRDSTFALFKQIINNWGMSNHFKINSSELRIRCLLTRGEIIFKGLDDSEKLKSITFSSGELTDIWIEEASEIDEVDFQQLDVRLRGAGVSKQIVISFNPINVNHWLKKRFIDKADEDVLVMKSTYKDNKFIDKAYCKLLEGYKETDPYYYQVYCLGEWGVFGKTVFDALKVNERLALNAKPCKVGYFAYDYNELAIYNVRWVEDPNGYIKIYSDVVKGRPYVIGGDTSGEGSDYFIGQVLDNTNGTQVAVLRNTFDEDLYSKQMVALGQYYNDALIGVESNYSSYPIKELSRLGYNHQYVRVTEDSYTHKPVQSFGFKTTSITRPLIIAELVKIVREMAELICDKDTLDEMLTFVRNEKGRPEAQSGAHDDCVMALAIAHYIRTQQDTVSTEVTETVKVPWREDMFEDYYNANDAGKDYLVRKWGNPF